MHDLALSDIKLSDFPVVQAWRNQLFDPEWIPEICDELPRLLTEFLRRRLPLSRKKKLRFYIESCDVPGDYTILWKVLNRGDEAFRRKCTRGTINKGGTEIIETTDFNGDHIVECYIAKEGVIVAKNRIHVPIE